MTDSSRTTAVRAWLHSLNVLLKSVRLYGSDHELVTGQQETAWSQLQSALPSPNESGLLLGVSGSDVLLDGAPLKLASAERGLSQFLSAAGVASIYFSPHITRDDFLRFVHAFAGAGKADLAERLQAALGTGEEAPIRVNEVRFVIEDAALHEAPARAATLTATSLGMEAEPLLSLVNDPLKLIELIAAAEVSHGAPASRVPLEDSASEAVGEGEVVDLLQLMSAAGDSEARLTSQEFEDRLAHLTGAARDLLTETLGRMAAHSSTGEADKPPLVELAESLAIRFAMDRYERGEVRVNAVRELLHRMSKEIENLRKIGQARAERMAQAGIKEESEEDILDREFWASVPDSGKRSVLLSPEAWCIPPNNVRQFVEKLLHQGDTDTARAILDNYAACLHTAETEARSKVADGLGKLTELYARPDMHLLDAALRRVGEQLSREEQAEVQDHLVSLFTRLAQEANARRDFLALEQAFERLDELRERQSSLSQSLQSSLRLEAQLPAWVETALTSPPVAGKPIALLERFAEAATAELIAQFRRCVRIEERDRVSALAQALGPKAAAHLRTTLRTGSPAEAAATVGLLSRLDLSILNEVLPQRLREWNRSYHQLVVRQLTMAAAAGRGALLVRLFEVLDPLVLPQALDEIGMSGERAIAPQLIGVASGKLTRLNRPYLRVKAIEALGRLRDPVAAPFLQQLVEAKKLWRWLEPQEIRTVAAQALRKIDSAWAQRFLPQSGLHPAELALAPTDPTPDSPWVETRRYERILLAPPAPAVLKTSQGRIQLTLKMLSLGGGLASVKQSLGAGTVAEMEVSSGWRPIRFQVILYEAPARDVAFAISDISLEERARLRHFLVTVRSRSA